MDVIEHLPRPLDALHKLAGLLVPGGRLVVFTGNTAAWTWRLAGLDYWYSALPEHLAFFGPHWFRWAAPQLGCEVERVEQLPHRPAGRADRVDEAVKNLAYLAYRRLGGAGRFGRAVRRLPGVRRVGRWDGCWWTTARDHMLVVLRTITPPAVAVIQPPHDKLRGTQPPDGIARTDDEIASQTEARCGIAFPAGSGRGTRASGTN